MKSTKRELLSGIFYTAIAKYSNMFISLIVTGVLARLLSPKDFGVVAIATVIISFFGIFTDIGISPAIIQNKKLTQDDLTQIFSFTFWLGLIISFLFFFSAGFIAGWYQSPILKILCQLLAANLFLSAIDIVPNALIEKHKEFKFIALRGFIIQLCTGTLGVSVALLGGGLYALIVSPIISALLVFFISFRRYPQHLKMTLGLESMGKIFSYSFYQFLFNLINYFSRNLDKLLIGKYLSLSLLGYYEKSYRLMMLPLQNITVVITPVIHPIFSEFQNDINYLAKSYEKIVRFLAFLGFPIGVLLFFIAKELTLIIFGNQWMPSIPIFQILCFSVGIQVVMSSSGSIFQAAGFTKHLFICGLFSSIANVVGFLISIFLFRTLTSVAVSICITFLINFIQCYWFMYFFTFKRNIWHFINQLIRPLVLSSIIFVVLFFVSHFIVSLNIFVTLIIKCIAFLIIFVTFIEMTGEYTIIGKVKEQWHNLKSKNEIKNN